VCQFNIKLDRIFVAEFQFILTSDMLEHRETDAAGDKDFFFFFVVVATLVIFCILVSSGY
jgi:hypothetical protein